MAAVLAAVITVIREPALLKRPEFAFEDGSIFYLGALLDGARSIVEPYAGYLHVATRLIAFPETWVPIAQAPLAGSTAAICVIAFTAAYLQRLPTSRSTRLGLAAVVVLLPAVRQVLGFVYNVQWYLAIAMVAAAFVRPNRFDLWLLAILALTGPFSILLLPLFIAAARDRRALIVGAGAVVQLVLLLTTPRMQSVGEVSPLLTFEILGYRGIALRITGDRLTPPALEPSAIAMGVAAVVVLAVVAARRDRVTVGYAYAAIAIAITGTLIAPIRGHELLEHISGQRYFVMAGVALGAAALAGLASRERARMLSGAALMALLLIGAIRDFRVDPFPRQHWVDIAPSCIGSSSACEVPVYPPTRWTIQWEPEGAMRSVAGAWARRSPG